MAKDYEKKKEAMKTSTKRVNAKIEYLIQKEGKKPDVAAAIAHSMEERGEL
tara:strand:- start:781 stop:933 length:153 start_codon:yes stop_codon:yes gene_type:complete